MKRLFVVLVLILSLINPIYYVVNADDKDSENIDYDEIINLLQTTAEIENSPQINSRYAVIYDRTSGEILYGKKENERCKMASTTKIMTAIVVIEKANLTDIVEISKKAAGTGGSRLGLKAKDRITVNDLLYGLMLCSGNDAAVALAEYVGGDVAGFASLMNEKVKKLRLENTNFVTPHGLDEEEHYTTAYELAKIADYALKIPKLAEIVRTKNYTITINGNAKNLRNTNELLGNLNGVYGIKTGFTNGANRCLVTSVKRENLDIICVVLGADTKKFRTQDSIKLIEFIYSKYQMINIKELLEDFDGWKKIKDKGIDIEKGQKERIELELEKMAIESYPILKEKIKDISIDVNTINIVKAPVKKNNIVGTIQVKCKSELGSLNKSNNLICNVNIIAKENIKKRGIVDYLKIFMHPYYLPENL